MENERELDQIGQDIQPYMYEPNPGDDVESDGSYSSTSSSGDDVDEEFEQANSWRLTSLEWCKCGHCQLMTRTIGSFFCCEKAVEYMMNTMKDCHLLRNKVLPALLFYLHLCKICCRPTCLKSMWRNI